MGTIRHGSFPSRCCELTSTHRGCATNSLAALERFSSRTSTATSPATRSRESSLRAGRSFGTRRATCTTSSPATCTDAVARLGFVQADPIRAPARAQDLTLRHRVADYRADDLERRYAELDVEEDIFINYGYLPRSVHALMHPRTVSSRPPAPR